VNDRLRATFYECDVKGGEWSGWSAGSNGIGKMVVGPISWKLDAINSGSRLQNSSVSQARGK
jgi:hypothetical protein